MANIVNRYMTVSYDTQPEGMNLTCWMSTVDFWMSEQVHYPHKYTHMGDVCTWLIHSNVELTNKVISMVVETADSICERQTRINAKRKIANI